MRPPWYFCRVPSEKSVWYVSFMPAKKIKRKFSVTKVAKKARVGKTMVAKTMVLWPNPKAASSYGGNGYKGTVKVSSGTSRVIANTTVTFHGALSRLADK